MRILLLGGTGAMGASLTGVLASQGHKVTVTSRSPRTSADPQVNYLQGNAHDANFLEALLRQHYDAVVDFMVYRPDEFQSRAERFLDATGQYLFLSSSRVYAASDAPLTEDSPRLLDVCTDKAYLATNEYALAKAREEDLLFASKRKNWTIIRPYITYNTQRLQLGCAEKELWLWRALRGRSVPLPQDVAARTTTLTYGGDVAQVMAALIGNENACGEAFHPTGDDAMTWREVAQLYSEVLAAETGAAPHFYAPASSRELSVPMGNKYQTVYDRLFDRRFDNSKVRRFCGKGFAFTPMREGLAVCLRAFLQQPEWRAPSAFAEAYLDRQSGEKPALDAFPVLKARLKYLGYYYAPGLMRALRR